MVFRDLPEHSLAGSAASLAASLDSAPAAAPVALIVDDFAPLAAALGERLTVDGYSAVIATNAASAREWLRREQTCQLAFVDISLPDGSGFAVAAEVRAACPECVIAIISGFGLSRRDRRLRGCVDAVLRKPWHGSELRAVLDLVPTRRQARGEVDPGGEARL